MKSDPKPGSNLSHYRILSKLGGGGMGEVYLAEDTKLNRRVAVKILPEAAHADKQAHLRLIREARTAANLDHPNICAIHEIAEDGGHSFICMQYIEGETLDTLLKRKTLSQVEILSIAVQVADALAEAHSHETIHRDIKPSNIMITSRGAVKVMDFGLAKLIQPEQIASEAETAAMISTPGAVIGTLPYMSPEQVRGESLDGRSDIFSFGVVLYEMLSGHQPFLDKSSAGTASAILTWEPLPLARFAPDISTELERIVLKTLQKDPDDRYQTAKDLLIDLRNLRDELQFQNRLERSASTASGIAQSFRPLASQSGATLEKDQTETIVADKRITLPEQQHTLPVQGKSKRYAVIALVVFAVITVGWLVRQNLNQRWARKQIPQIQALSKAGRNFEAFDLAVQTQKYLSDDPIIQQLMPTISDSISVSSDPIGASVYLERFTANATRQLIGQTPIANLQIARGQYVLYIEKEGYAPTEQTVSGAFLHSGGSVVMPPPIKVDKKLIAADKVPARMTPVTGGDYRLVAWARPTDERVHLDDYFIDKYEVSNQEYKEFINGGGYLKKQYWKYPFIKDGKTLTWEQAMEEFKDRTGLPGPRGWTNQTFPEGKGNYPVTDVSWYEAAAYAAFRGKQLPTIFQWEKAGRNGSVGALTNYMPWGVFYPGDTLDQRANFGSDETWPVDSGEFGMSPFGAFNMAGNVSEWCLNETSEGFLSAGGAWGDPVYSFANYGGFPGFYSSEKRGFRCAVSTGEAQGNITIKIEDAVPVYARTSDADFNKWLRAYDYEKRPLDPQVEKQETPEWTRERITFNGADGERAIAYLYLPKNFPGPFQVIHYLPPGDVEIGQRSATQAAEQGLGAQVKLGRALFVVIIKGYIERLLPEGYVEPDPTKAEYRDKIVNRITDLRRALDYLETRNDIDSKKIALFGMSSGARVGLIQAAVERRYAAVFLAGSGLRKAYAQNIAEANIINFASHIRGPIMLLHGKYDDNLSLKREAEPLFKILPEPKQMVTYEGGHVPPLDLLVKTMNGFFDQSMGPVKRE
jgi:serine/threonine protein kinase/formylglycine-generating enzyme required for sulfatase activity